MRRGAWGAWGAWRPLPAARGRRPSGWPRSLQPRPIRGARPTGATGATGAGDSAAALGADTAAAQTPGAAAADAPDTTARRPAWNRTDTAARPPGRSARRAAPPGPSPPAGGAYRGMLLLWEAIAGRRWSMPIDPTSRRKLPHFAPNIHKPWGRIGSGRHLPAYRVAPLRRVALTPHPVRGKLVLLTRSHPAPFAPEQPHTSANTAIASRRTSHRAEPHRPECPGSDPKPCRFCRRPCHSLPLHCHILPFLPPRTRNGTLPQAAKWLEFSIREEVAPGTPPKSGKNGNVH